MPKGMKVFHAEMNLDDLRGVQRRLAALAPAVARRAVRPAVRYAFTPVLQTARRMVPVEHGDLKQSLGLSVYTKTRKGEVFGVVQPDSAFKNQQTGARPAFTAHLVEFGTEPHEIPLGGPVWLPARKGSQMSGTGFGQWVSGQVSHPGAPPKPFLRPALTECQWQVLGRYHDKLMQGIDKEVAKAARKAAV